MCLAVYIASGHALPIGAGDQAWPTLRIEETVRDPDNPVRQHVSKSFIYSAGPSDGGCGCAFLFGVSCIENDAGESVEIESPEGVAMRRGLANFLLAALQHQAEVEVFTCCSGDEPYPAKYRRRARPADFVSDRTLFRFGELVVVSEEGSGPAMANCE